VIVYFEYRAWWLFTSGWCLLLRRSSTSSTASRATAGDAVRAGRLDLDRVGEAFMLTAIALTFMRDGREWAVALTVVAVIGSFLVSYTRAKAEILGLKGDVGIGSRAERVAVIAIGLGLGSVGGLQWAIALLALTAWATAAQRILFVRKQLLQKR
jgi:CDP-diacylglycerol--glycerol-3-phosphate 3-phosphatidyltransferase